MPSFHNLTCKVPEMDVNKKIIKPQKGFQVQFMSSQADITIGGAAAGVGKSWCLLAAPLRHKDTYGFNCIIFRRTTEQIRNPGGLWDKSMEIYPQFGFKSSEQQLEWYKQDSKVTIKLTHLQHEKNIYDHDGPEYCLIGWDELHHFSKKQFFYLMSRNRSTCGVKPYILATCNPDPDSWLSEFIEWWIDQEEKLPNGEKNPGWGFPIKERIGVLRYFVMYDEKYIWANSKEELILKNPDIFDKYDATINPHDLIKSVTFISGSIFDNQELLSKNPQYLANLTSLDPEERMRLFDGNWKIRGKDDCIFNAMSIIGMFDNMHPGTVSKRYITVDAARFGPDFLTCFVWYGWKVVKLVILTKCDEKEAVDAIERERNKYNIIKANVIVDQDGLGGGIVKSGRYTGFSGNAPAIVEKVTHIKEDYKNRKTQFAYRLAEKVNNNEVSVVLGTENVLIDGYPGIKIKINGTIFDIRDLIKQDFRAIRKKDPDGEGKKQINTKLEQKTLCGGRSPDFFDGMSLRVHFDMNSTEIKTASATRTGRSLLDLL